MSKNIRNGIIAFAVVFVSSFLLNLYDRGGTGHTIPSMGLGLLTYVVLASRSKNAPETIASMADRTAALQALPPAGSALLFVSRSGFVGNATGIDFLLDGVTFAQLRSPRFTSIVITPGPHTVAAVKESTSAYSLAVHSTIQVTALPDERIFITLAMKMGGVKANVELTRISDPEVALKEFAPAPMVVAKAVTTAPPPPQT